MSVRTKLVPRDPADIDRLNKMRQRWRKRTKELEKALVQAVEKHGHDFHCSARMGMESDCTCGWTRVKQMVRDIRG